MRKVRHGRIDRDAVLPLPGGIEGGMSQQEMEALYADLQKGPALRFWNLPKQDRMDHLHDLFVATVTGAKRADTPVQSYASGVARILVILAIRAAVRQRRMVEVDADDTRLSTEPSPEKALIAEQRRERCQRLLNGLSPAGREVLERFYLQEQEPERICAEMQLSRTQFRLLKSRAKATLTQHAKNSRMAA